MRNELGAQAFINIAWAWQLLPKGVKWQTRRPNDDEAKLTHTRLS